MSERFVSGVLAHYSPAGVAALAQRLAEDLLARGALGSAGLVVELRTTDLEPFESGGDPTVDTAYPAPGYVSVGYGKGTDRAQTSWRCMCGWTTEDVAEIVEHLRGHGASRVVVTPDTPRRRR